MRNRLCGSRRFARTRSPPFASSSYARTKNDGSHGCSGCNIMMMRPLDFSNASRSATPRCGRSTTMTSKRSGHRVSNRAATDARSVIPGTSRDTSMSGNLFLRNEQHVGEEKETARNDLDAKAHALEGFGPSLSRTEVQALPARARQAGRRHRPFPDAIEDAARIDFAHEHHSARFQLIVCTHEDPLLIREREIVHEIEQRDRLVRPFGRIEQVTGRKRDVAVRRARRDANALRIVIDPYDVQCIRMLERGECEETMAASEVEQRAARRQEGTDATVWRQEPSRGEKRARTDRR